MRNKNSGSMIFSFIILTGWLAAVSSAIASSSTFSASPPDRIIRVARGNSYLPLLVLNPDENPINLTLTSDSSFFSQESFLINPGRPEELQLPILIADDIPNGEYTLLIMARGTPAKMNTSGGAGTVELNQGVILRYKLNLTGEQIKSLSCRILGARAEENSSLFITIKVRNNGSVRLRPGLKAYLRGLNHSIGTGYHYIREMLPGESAVSTVIINRTELALKRGLYNLSVGLYSGRRLCLDSSMVDVKRNGFYSLNISSCCLNVILRGELIRISLTVKNSGVKDVEVAPIADVSLIMQNPSMCADRNISCKGERRVWAGTIEARPYVIPAEDSKVITFTGNMRSMAEESGIGRDALRIRGLRVSARVYYNGFETAPLNYTYRIEDDSSYKPRNSITGFASLMPGRNVRGKILDLLSLIIVIALMIILYGRAKRVIKE